MTRRSISSCRANLIVWSAFCKTFFDESGNFVKKTHELQKFLCTRRLRWALIQTIIDLKWRLIMAQPTTKPIDPAEVLTRAQAVVQADRFPYLATMDGDQPRLRPVSPVRTDGFTVYVANLRDYHKTAELAAKPNAARR